MKNKFIICIFTLFYFHCEDDVNSSSILQSNCGLETTFVHAVDSLKWPKGNDIVLAKGCGYVGVGRLSSRPWIIKFDEEGQKVWSKIFEEIPIPTGNYSDGYQYASAIEIRAMEDISSVLQ